MKVGPKMRQAIQVVREFPGCTKLHVAELVGPNGSRQYGYRIVDRCIRRGIISAKKVGGKYALTVAEHEGE